VNLYNGTNLYERSLIIGRSGGMGSYTADGASFVQVNYTNRTLGNLVLGQDVNSTGTFTVAGTSQVIATNAANNSTIYVGQGGKGTFLQTGGTVLTDKLMLTNGANSVFTLSGGTFNPEATIVGAGASFTVGSGSIAGTYNLLGGGHAFADGLTLSNNGWLTGSGTLTGNLVNAAGNVAPGGTNATALISMTGDFTNQASGTFRVEVNGTNALAYDQLSVTGTVTLAGLIRAKVAASLNFGDKVTLINNDGSDPVVGTFANAAEGLYIPQSSVDGIKGLRLSYHGGTGNDVVATVSPVANATLILIK
jgi:hypothetical protein